MSLPDNFSQQKLLECLYDPKNFTSKYKQFKNAFLEQQQQYIHQSFHLLKEKLESEIGHPMNKMHILRAIKEGVDTGSFGVLQIVESDILNILERIAMYKSESSDQDRGKTLFLEDLKQPSLKQEYQKIGNSYFRLVLECIEVWATIKPYFVSGSQEVQKVPSGYAQLYAHLKKQKIAFPQKKSYYKIDDLDAGKFRNKYLQGLIKLASKPQKYTDYYANKISSALQSEQKYKSSQTQVIINMITLPDYLLQQNTLNIITQNLADGNPPLPKILSLRLLCELFHAGSINVLDHSQYIIFPILIKTIRGLENVNSKGSKLFANNPKLGEKYYGQMLKTIVLLAESCPKDPITKQETQLNKILNELKNNNYELPIVPELADYSAQYEENIHNYLIINKLYKRNIPNVIASTKSPKFPSQNNKSTPNQMSSQPKKVQNQLKKSNVSQRRLVIPNFNTQTDPYVIINTVNSIYSELKMLSPQNQLVDRQWLRDAYSYLIQYNKEIQEILSKYLKISDFEELVEKAFDLLETNTIICKKIKDSNDYPTKILHLNQIINKTYDTPRVSILNSPKSTQKVQESKRPSEMIASSKVSQRMTPSQNIKKQNQEIKQNMYYQDNEDSMSSNQKKMYKQQKFQEKEVIAQYKKQHFDSMRRENLQYSQDISKQDLRNKNGFTQSQRNNLKQESQRSYIQNILDQQKLSQVSEVNIPFNDRNNQSLIFKPSSSRQKNRIGVQKLNQSVSLSQSAVKNKQNNILKQMQSYAKKEISKQQIRPNRDQVKTIPTVERKQQAQQLQGKDIISLVASFGNVGYLPNQNGQSYNFKKKNNPQTNQYQSILPSKPNQQFEQTFQNPYLRTGQPKQQPFINNFLEGSSEKNQTPINQLKNIPTRQEEVSEIIEPGLEPLTDSFYEPQKQMKQQIQKMSVIDSPQFNACFDTQKYLIPSKSFGGEAKKYWLQQDAKMLTTFNRSNFDHSIKSQKLTNTVEVTIPEIIAQKNKYFQIQVQGIRDQHKKQTSFLEAKIRKLQKLNKQQEKILDQQKSQIQSLRGGVNSDINLGATFKSHQQQFLQHQNQVLKSRLQARSHYQSRNMSPIRTISEGFKYSRQKFSKIDKGQIFPSQPYQQFISIFSEFRVKKPMIKNKDLLAKNQNIQVGFILSKQKNCIRVALFAQSQVNDLSQIRLYLNSKGLNLECYPEQFCKQLKAGKQERYVVVLYIDQKLKLPYQLPEIQISYKIKEKSQEGMLQFVVPLTFNRLLQYVQIDASKFKQIYKDKGADILRGQEVCYNKKIIKDIISMKQLLPKLEIMNPYKQSLYQEGKAVLKFGVKAVYEPYHIQFLIKINLKPGSVLYIQTIPLTKPSNNRVVEQFLICTLNQLVKKSW